MTDAPVDLWHRFRSIPMWIQVAAWVVFFPLPLGIFAWTRPSGVRTIALVAWLAWSAVPLVIAFVTPAPIRSVQIRAVAPPTTTTSPIPPTTVQSVTGPPSTDTPPTQPPPTEPLAPPEPATTAPTSSPSGGSPLALIGALHIAAEGSRSGYSRGQFGHGWIDANRNGCDTRCEVLAQERRTDLPGLQGGGWLSSYDGYTTDNPHQLQIDHMVPLAEAWESGASAWAPDRRRDYANDLDFPGALNAVTASSNESKGDRDPAEWQPPNRTAWCSYVADWVTVKVKWGLSADHAEVVALLDMAKGC